MTLAKHRRTRSSGIITPFWLLTIPRWAAAADSTPRAAAPATQTRWACARCGAVASDIASATEHINLHSLNETSRPAVAGCPAAPPRPGPRRRRGKVRGRIRAARPR